MHDLTFGHVELHSPLLHPCQQCIKRLLYFVSVLAQLCVVSELLHNVDPHHRVQVIYEDGEQQGAQHFAIEDHPLLSLRKPCINPIQNGPSNPVCVHFWHIMKGFGEGYGTHITTKPLPLSTTEVVFSRNSSRLVEHEPDPMLAAVDCATVQLCARLLKIGTYFGRAVLTLLTYSHREQVQIWFGVPRY